MLFCLCQQTYKVEGCLRQVVLLRVLRDQRKARGLVAVAVPDDVNYQKLQRSCQGVADCMVCLLVRRIVEDGQGHPWCGTGHRCGHAFAVATNPGQHTEGSTWGAAADQEIGAPQALRDPPVVPSKRVATIGWSWAGQGVCRGLLRTLRLFQLGPCLRPGVLPGAHLPGAVRYRDPVLPPRDLAGTGFQTAGESRGSRPRKEEAARLARAAQAFRACTSGCRAGPRRRSRARDEDSRGQAQVLLRGAQRGRAEDCGPV